MCVLHALFQLLPHTRYSLYGHEKQAHEEQSPFPGTCAHFLSGIDHQEKIKINLVYIEHLVMHGCAIIEYIDFIEYKSSHYFQYHTGCRAK